MNKAALRDQLILQLHTGLLNQTSAAHLARDEAISEESRADSKYDTHSQEAAYLAEGQARLAAEIQASIAFYQTFTPAPIAHGAPIALGAVVELRTGKRSTWYFVGPRAGGTEISFDGKTVLVLTPQSPLGRQLIGRCEGDFALAPNPGSSERAKIATVL